MFVILNEVKNLVFAVQRFFTSFRMTKKESFSGPALSGWPPEPVEGTRFIASTASDAALSLRSQGMTDARPHSGRKEADYACIFPWAPTSASQSAHSFLSFFGNFESPACKPEIRSFRRMTSKNLFRLKWEPYFLHLKRV